MKRKTGPPGVVVPKRSWKSRLLELALWAAVSITTALIMILLSEKLLPENF